MPPSPSADTTLRAALVEAFLAMGGSVRVFAAAENLVRTRRDGDPPQPFVVEVEGVPNLLHELGHALLLGHLARDHGTDFSAIPFSLDDDDGRRLLHEELACCVVSCRWHPGNLEQAHAWFDAQIGSQAAFFGAEGDPEGFLQRVDAWILRRDPDLDSTIHRAELALTRSLDATKAGPGRLRPRHLLELPDWWARHRDPGDTPAN